MIPSGPIITLTTDFGGADGDVGAVKGVILSICPQAQVIEIAHDIMPHDVAQAAIALESACGYFPPGTVHLAVVDPGVGTNRRRLGVLTQTAFFVGPDNGIFGLVLRRTPPQRVISIQNEAFFLRSPATTFDGRDVFAPVAAYLANGLDPAELGPEIHDPVALPWPENVVGRREATGAVVTVDRFGNLVTSLHRWDLPEDMLSFTVQIKEQRIAGPARSYYDLAASAEAKEYRALFGGNGYLEIALPGASAHERLPAGRGDIVHVWW